MSVARRFRFSPGGVSLCYLDLESRRVVSNNAISHNVNVSILLYYTLFRLSHVLLVLLVSYHVRECTIRF